MYEKAREYLLGYGIRPSLQRMAVMEYLLTHKTHPTADGIFSALYPSIPTLSRTTVYNTLSMLAGCGAILTLDLDPQQMHYDGETSPHAHFICTRCGHIHDIWPDSEGWRGMLAAAPPPAGASVTDIQLSYKGLCSACKTHHNN
ncbi:MAG: transcriptional repressor [Rikenellaceae bacterium]|jgi:Fur family ferric uptake transcriptional regulator/Fur family peroxide stress response transcriptional regulator|nr:transcriptional repressor [Rikenellaceae bacterium]